MGVGVGLGVAVGLVVGVGSGALQAVTKKAIAIVNKTSNNLSREINLPFIPCPLGFLNVDKITARRKYTRTRGKSQRIAVVRLVVGILRINPSGGPR